MSLETLRRYAASLPGAPRDIERGADECYSSGALIAAKLTKKTGVTTCSA